MLSFYERTYKHVALRLDNLVKVLKDLILSANKRGISASEGSYRGTETDDTDKNLVSSVSAFGPRRSLHIGYRHLFIDKNVPATLR